MASKEVIAISPAGYLSKEPRLINQLFEAGLYRYHIRKESATEQSIAELLQLIEPKYLGKITLHSHYHLVLAYGVGGIHYTVANRKAMKEDFPLKTKLYQGFGVKVSTDINLEHQEWLPANYSLTQDRDLCNVDGNIFYLSKAPEKSSMNRVAIYLDQWLEMNQASKFPALLQSYILNT